MKIKNCGLSPVKRMKSMPMRILQNLALKVLGITLEQAKFAKAMGNPAEKRNTAAKVIGLKSEVLNEARKLSSQGKETYSLNTLGIQSKELLDKFLQWSTFSKEKKVEEMLNQVEQYVDTGDSPRSFLNGVYTRYLRFKHKNGVKWKDTETPSIYLIKLKSIADKCIVSDTMTMDDFHKICLYSYFFLKLKLVGQKTESKVIQMNTATDVQKAA